MIPESQERIPYVGPRPFEEQDRELFFGRDRELNELLSLAIAHRALLLYAQSGAGKTSLINAGLIPMLAEEEFEILPIARVRGIIPEDMQSEEIQNLYIFNTIGSLVEDEANLKRLAKMSLDEFVREREHSTDEEGRPSPRIVIFDQFEELFTFYPERWKERKEFFWEVAEALEADPLLRVLFVIREDYLASLDSYVDFLPEQLSTRYRLERLDADGARQAVEGPLQETERSFAEGVASSLVRQLLNIRIKSAAGEFIEVAGEYVEPVQLQVVCQSLWLNLPHEVTDITSEHLHEFGDVEEAIRNFYERAIEIVMWKTGVREGDLRDWFDNKLITPAGTRGTVFKGKDQTEGIPNSVAEELETKHIIRAELRAGAHWYELTHDQLIEPIRKSNEVWFENERVEEQQREVEAERKRAEQAQRLAVEKTKSARLLLVLLVIVVGLAMASIYLFIGQKRISRELEIASNDLTVASGKLKVSLEKEKALSELLDGFLASGIKELKNDPNTKATAEMWEEQLNDIRESRKLAEIAETAVHIEAVYATWIRLGEFINPPWPSEKKDLDRDRKIRSRLKTGFEANIHQDETRGYFILQKVARTGLQREVVFIEEKNSLQDKVLREFCKFAVDEISSNTLGKLENLEKLAKRLADLVSDPDWPEKFLMDLMAEENPVYKKTNLAIKDFEKWIIEVTDYRVLEPDPRLNYLQDQTVQEIRELINKVRTNLPDQASQFQQRLETDEQRILELYKIPAIVKYKTDINKITIEFKTISERLNKLKLELTPIGIPSWCKRVSIDRAVSGGKYTIALLSRQLRDKFVPISTSHKRPIEVVQGSYQELRREDFVEEEYELVSSLNAGWPKYIASSKDPSVILRFIPSGPDNSEPFYMATHETTNAQYRLFLEKTGAKSPTNLTGWTYFADESNNALIVQTQGQYPPSRINWEKTKSTFILREDFKNFPVTWVTYNGAKSYVKWLGGKLPSASEHKYACKAGTNSLYPWAKDPSEIAKYAHVRAGDWLIARDAYNSKLGSLIEIIEPPIGAVKPEDFIPYKTKLEEFGPDEVVHRNTITYNSPWPTAGAAKPNAWGLYDMIGNVWEWCHDDTQPVICGGSCLAPPEYILKLESNYIYGFNKTASDVGFRIIVPVR